MLLLSNNEEYIYIESKKEWGQTVNHQKDQKLKLYPFATTLLDPKDVQIPT